MDQKSKSIVNSFQDINYGLIVRASKKYTQNEEGKIRIYERVEIELDGKIIQSYDNSLKVGIVPKAEAVAFTKKLLVLVEKAVEESS